MTRTEAIATLQQVESSLRRQFWDDVTNTQQARLEAAAAYVARASELLREVASEDAQARTVRP